MKLRDKTFRLLPWGHSEFDQDAKPTQLPLSYNEWCLTVGISSRNGYSMETTDEFWDAGGAQALRHALMRSLNIEVPQSAKAKAAAEVASEPFVGPAHFQVKPQAPKPSVLTKDESAVAKKVLGFLESSCRRGFALKVTMF